MSAFDFEAVAIVVWPDAAREAEMLAEAERVGGEAGRCIETLLKRVRDLERSAAEYRDILRRVAKVMRHPLFPELFAEYMETRGG